MPEQGGSSILNALTVDVEEYFHPTEVKAVAPVDQWPSFPSRVDDEVRTVLDLMDMRNVKATFFVLGWLAEHRPQVVKMIAERGHEIGCHSYSHQLVYEMTPQAFRHDTLRAVQAIEDACGITPIAYRAPSYSITSKSFWALEILVECGFTLDSSIYPISHDRYGIPGFSRHAQMVTTASGPICEVPIATVQLSKSHVAPVGGGGYLRLLPYSYTRAGLRKINGKESKPACVYFHPWEIDADQPRLAHGCVSRLRTYTGLSAMKRKIERLLTDFRFSTLSAIYPSVAAPVKGAGASSGS